MNAALVCVVTTIQPPTASMRRLAEVLDRVGAKTIVIGDRKGPADFALPGCAFYSFDQQAGLPWALASRLPAGHYARKNLGYLEAFAEAPQCIYETDDDNAPSGSFLTRSRTTAARSLESSEPWVNVYAAFTREHVWPRGLPLDRILDRSWLAPLETAEVRQVDSPIQQGLADGAPDVDAIWRLVLDKPITFDRSPSVHLPPNTWCPFNSQTTWWWPVAYPLMYLPSHCSFRMTDIWRSFVAQRCLWELGYGLIFHTAEVTQERNVHNLMRDFADEVPGYTNNGRIADLLGKLDLRAGDKSVTWNMRRCYGCLVEAGLLPQAEITLLEAWIADTQQAMKGDAA